MSKRFGFPPPPKGVILEILKILDRKDTQKVPCNYLVNGSCFLNNEPRQNPFETYSEDLLQYCGIVVIVFACIVKTIEEDIVLYFCIFI